MNYQKHKLLTAFLLITVLSVMVFAAVQIGRSQDTVKVSLQNLDQQISQRDQELRTLLQQIEQAKQNAVYLQGALDNLKDMRNKFAVKDTVKAETKKKGK